MLKLNTSEDADKLQEIYNYEDPENEWFVAKTVFLQPFLKYLEYTSTRKEQQVVSHYSMGLHTNGLAGKCHYHINISVDNLPNNILINYKYFYRYKYLPTSSIVSSTCTSEKLDQLAAVHFKAFPHSIKTDTIDDLKGFLSYPYKECVDGSTSWKASYGDQLDPHSRQELMNYGSGVYMAACRARVKIEEKETLKLEKWSAFCKHMDDLRNTPTVHVMGDLRGVCLVALEFFRQLPERASVNAVITMCKDYAFKRGIWTDEQILDKYQIV